MKKRLLLIMCLCLLVGMNAFAATITFADANVKAICVANWDTNHDGELSESEAAADVSGDGNITITDAVAVVNMILGNGNSVRELMPLLDNEIMPE